MAPSEWSGIFVVQLVGDTLRAPMTEEFAADMMGPILQRKLIISMMRTKIIYKHFSFEKK